MQWFVDQYLNQQTSALASGAKLRLLDVGSYDVNGTYKQFFSSSKYDYVGLDMAEGPNVDLVPACPYQWNELESDSFDVVISGQVLEHSEFFWITVSEMVRVLKKNGILCIIAPNGFPEHRYPVDCYRFFADGMIALARYTGLEIIHAHTDCQPSVEAAEWHMNRCEDTMLIARKPYSGETNIVDVSTYTCVPANLDEIRKPLLAYDQNLPASILHRAYRKLGRVMGILY